MSYTLLRGGTAIHCGTCGRISHNVSDVEKRYCGHCNKFHDDGLYGVIEDRTGFVLVADTREACERLAERWHAICGTQYTVRGLTRDEEAMARRWRDPSWLHGG